MNRIQFGEGGCEKTRKYLDSYISNELLVETNHEVLRHLENCTGCTAELDARTQLRGRLKSAVEAQSVPPDLQVRIREQIRKREQGSWLTSGWGRWVAVAASVVVCAGIWLNQPNEKLPAIADRRAQNAYIQKVSTTLASVLKVGLGDHIHCSIFRKYPKEPPTIEQMETSLGPAYQGLLPVVRAAVPDGYRIIMAHECSYAGRKYIHLTMSKDGELLSLVIARRENGEMMSGLARSHDSAGVPIYQSSADRYQVAGFEAGNFLAYVVSDLKAKANLQIASNMAHGVREFLMKVAA
jgi:anti-sigma factor (TIGR02949 family)